MFNLTQQERRVILFLITMALIGMGVNFLIKRYSPDKATIAYFDRDIGKIDLNSADKDSLMSVSGIGEKIARQIIEYREKHNCFQDTEELKKIKGINSYRYEKIKDSFVVR